MLGVGGNPPKKVAQNELKHILVSEFLRSDDFLGALEGVGGLKSYIQARQTDRQTHGHYRD